MGIFFLVLAALIVWGVLAYNNFVSLRNRARNAWADIDVQLKRRHDLIPNLVETVKGYASHEREVFERVTEARARAAASKSIEDRGRSEGELTRALRQLFAVAENYPELKANENFLSLQNSLNEIENAVQNARRYYNAVVRDYNIKRESFPSNIIANLFNFAPLEFFRLEDESEREVPKVDFS
ncbi:MAG: LemA family protein [Candidatus Hydrothermae bacterium]|nr:LemA family protein [Candidatus Hydrothermae bacterium]